MMCAPVAYLRALVLTALLAWSTSAVHAQPAAALPPSPRRVVVDGVDLTGVGYDEGSPTAPVVVVKERMPTRLPSRSRGPSGFAALQSA